MKNRRKSQPGPRVVVVGAGIMGTATALELARNGATVTVLEKAIPGAEASSAAAGIIAAEYENAEPGPMQELCRKSQALYPGWVKTLESESGVSVEFLGGGALELARDKAEFSELLKRRRRQLLEGRATKLDRAELRELEPDVAPSFAGAVHFPTDRRVTPSALFRAVHVAAVRAGVTFRSGQLVARIAIGEHARGGPAARGVELEDGTLVAGDATVVAAGSWTTLVAGLPLPRSAVLPARGQLVELDLGLPCLRRLIMTPSVYLIPRSDGRVVVGSTLEFVGYEKAVTARGLHDLLAGALDAVPRLSQASVLRSWSNFRPYTEDHLPLLGEVGVKGLYVASGHFRNGIQLAPITAKLVRQLVLGQRPSLDLAPFDPRRLTRS